MEHRVVSPSERLRVKRECAVTGGIIKNIGVVQGVEKALSVRVVGIKLSPEIAGAVSAVLIAKDFITRSGKVG